MKQIPLDKYYENKNEYGELNKNRTKVKLKDHNLVFHMNDLPYEPIEHNGEKIIIPAYVKTDSGRTLYLSKYGDIAKVENFVIIVDEILDGIVKTRQLERNLYINIDDYVVSEKYHWFNNEVMKFLKEKRSPMFTTDADKTKKILKILTNTNGRVIDYNKQLLPLFNMLGIDDSAFREYMTKRRR